MSNSEQQFLDMAELAGAEQSTEKSAEPTTKRAKETYTLCGLEADPTFAIPKAWIKRRFIDGEQASFWFWYQLGLVTPPQGMSRGELQDSKTPVQVMIKTPNGALVAATYHVAHKDGSTCTLSTVWPLSEAWLEHKAEQKPKRQKTGKSDAKAAKDAKVPAGFSGSAPEPFAVLYASERNLPPAPTPADLASFLRKIEGFVAPANATDTVVLLSPVLTELYTKWCEVDTDEVRAMGRGSKVMGSDFAPDALDLALIKHRVVPARDVAVVLGYEHAVVNDQFPHIAVGDSSWAERLAAPADAVVAAFSPARSTTTTEPDSSSDNEHSAPDVAAPAAQEVVDLTLDFEHDDSAQSAPAPAPRAAKKRKTPEHVEYIDLDD
jgi:hypothetical protein